MGAYKVNTTGRDSAEAAPIECRTGVIAERVARLLSADDMGHYWVTLDGYPGILTSFTGGQRDPAATAGGQS